MFNWKPVGDSVVEKEERPHAFRDYPDCGPQFTRSDYATYLIRYYEDSTFIARTPAATEPADDGITPQTAAAMTRCGVDLFGLDQILPEDGRLENLVWTWTPESPPAAGECAVQRGDSRWMTRPCGEARPAACRSPDGTWLLTAPVVHGRAATACKARRASFDLPRTGYDNAELRTAATAAGADEVWLAYPTPRRSRGQGGR